MYLFEPIDRSVEQKRGNIDKQITEVILRKSKTSNFREFYFLILWLRCKIFLDFLLKKSPPLGKMEENVFSKKLELNILIIHAQSKMSIVEV